MKLAICLLSVIKNRSFGRFWPVSWNISHRFWVPERFPTLAVCLRVGHQEAQFWPIMAPSCTSTHRFGVPERFPRLTTPAVCLRVGHKQSQFWPILAHFLDYYSPFWGTRVISMNEDHSSAFTCRSSIY